ncbi:hypothetical protein [Streptomyces sp. URMC 125]|uniref:hypothetical protein n=1 Tax=Streptomyces sp. URMC 125 TaxID=3423419 RepID=UPI003F19BC58
MSERTYTRDEISRAVNEGADLVIDEIGGERDADLINLVVNAIMTCLETPGADIDTVLEENYEDPDDVRSWWGRWLD